MAKMFIPEIPSAEKYRQEIYNMSSNKEVVPEMDYLYTNTLSHICKPKWDKRFLDLAEFIASWSKDPSTKCGSVIVDKNKRIISVGFNGFPSGTQDSEEIYNNRPEKYRRVLHAEQNAMAFANTDLKDCVLYVWPMPPCSQCAAMIIQRQIKTVVSIKPTKQQLSRWQESFNSAVDMFNQAGIELIFIGNTDDHKI